MLLHFSLLKSKLSLCEDSLLLTVDVTLYFVDFWSVCIWAHCWSVNLVLSGVRILLKCHWFFADCWTVIAFYRLLKCHCIWADCWSVNCFSADCWCVALCFCEWRSVKTNAFVLTVKFEVQTPAVCVEWRSVRTFHLCSLLKCKPALFVLTGEVWTPFACAALKRADTSFFLTVEVSLHFFWLLKCYYIFVDCWRLGV